jgi:hypothetical protein
MKYFIIDDLGIKHPFPYEAGSGPDPIESGAGKLEHVYTAGETIGMGRVLMADGGKVFYFEPGDESNSDKVVGISNGDALINSTVTVTAAGVLQMGGWGLTPDAVYYAGPVGAIITSPPISGVYLRIGSAIDSTKLKIELSDPIILI